MKIEQTISSCKAIFEYAFGSNLMYTFVFAIFFLIPFLTLTASLLKTYTRIKKLEEKNNQELPKKLVKILKKYNFDRKFCVVSCQNSFVALSVGFFSRKIYLSQPLVFSLSEKELEAVVLHEIYHLQNYHSVLLLFMDILTKMFFFLPFFQDVQSQLKFKLEQAADLYAVSTQKTTRYIKTSLRKIISSQDDFGVFPQFSYSVIDQRINSLNSKKTTVSFSLSRFLSSVLVIFVFFGLFSLNNRYAMASVMEEKITCSLFACVQNCVAYELNKDPQMSQINYSISR